MESGKEACPGAKIEMAEMALADESILPVTEKETRRANKYEFEALSADRQ